MSGSENNEFKKSRKSKKGIYRMSELNLTEEEKADLIEEVTELSKRNVLKKAHYVSILCVCQAACEERIEEIEQVIGKPSDIVQ